MRADQVLSAYREFIAEPEPGPRPEPDLVAFFHDVVASVPAYRAFLSDAGVDPATVHTVADFQRLPLLTKENYHRRYPLPDRCRDGRLDGCDMIAVSSGSTGQPTESGLIEDARAAYRFAAARYPAERIVLWGESLGTGVAVALAAEKPVSRLILESPYTSTLDVAAANYWFLPVRLLMKDQFRSDQRIARVKAPVLILHGEADGIIPIAYGERLYAMVPGEKRLVRFPSGGHNDLDDFGAMDVALKFLEKK